MMRRSNLSRNTRLPSLHTLRRAAPSILASLALVTACDSSQPGSPASDSAALDQGPADAGPAAPDRSLDAPSSLDQRAGEGLAPDTSAVDAGAPDSPTISLDDPRHFYGISWRGTPADNLKYAIHKGYTYVFYQYGMELEPLAQGMKYYIESPEFSVVPFSIEINLQQQYTPAQIAQYEALACFRSNEAFPKNLATGWPRNDHQCNMIYDFQQQKVIDYLVDLSLKRVKTLQAANLNFTFVGFAWDEANAHGDFWSHPHSRNQDSYDLGTLLQMIGDLLLQLILSGDQQTASRLQQIIPDLQEASQSNDYSKIEELLYDPVLGPIAQYGMVVFDPQASFHVPVNYWTKTSSCLLHAGITHEYLTYTDGILAYHKTILERVQQELGLAQVSWIAEPYQLYSSWVQLIESRSDGADYVPTLLSQENTGTFFVDDQRIFASQLVTRDRVGSSSPSHGGEEINRIIAAKAGINGAWFNWYGRFGGSRAGDMPNYQNIYEVPARHQLIRLVPNWDNLANVPLASRSWDGYAYESSNGYASPEVIYARHPETQRLFAVFLQRSGTIQLRANEQVKAVYRTDDFFMEQEDGSTDVDLSQPQQIRTTSTTPLEKGYIFELTSAP